jgi:glycosyltransferase involved in cell wall biosynthesis
LGKDTGPIAGAKADVTLAGRSIALNGLRPPLVSIILVNRNYEAYVGEAIDAIRAQHYPWFECFILDNASTDASRDVIARHVGDDPRFTVEHLAENLGQLRAGLRVFERLRGEFVVSADADDVLFPEYLASHVQVHLALPAHVGFTSSNIVEVDADRTVLTGGRSGFGADCEAEPRGLKPIAEVLRIPSVAAADYAALSAATQTVSIWKARWVWAPGTANMYRKSMLALALPDATRIRGHAGWDNYFCAMLHLMSGSALIHRHLSAYRFHGRNAFSHVPRVEGVQTARSFAVARSVAQRLHILRSMVSRADHFDAIFAGNRFWLTLDLLARIEGLAPRGYYAQGAVQDILAEHLPKLLEVFGAREVMLRLRQRLRFAAVWSLLGKAYPGKVPLALRWAFAQAEVRRRLARR